MEKKVNMQIFIYQTLDDKFKTGFVIDATDGHAVVAEFYNNGTFSGEISHVYMRDVIGCFILQDKNNQFINIDCTDETKLKVLCYEYY